MVVEVVDSCDVPSWSRVAEIVCCSGWKTDSWVSYGYVYIGRGRERRGIQWMDQR